MNAFHNFMHLLFSYSCHLVLKSFLKNTNKVCMYVTDLRFSNWIIAHDKALGFFFFSLLSQLIMHFLGIEICSLFIVNYFIHYSNIVENDLCCIANEM